MKLNPKILDARYYKYVNDITIKRINIYMPIGIGILLILMFLDFYIRNNIYAMYSRVPSILIALSLIILRNFKIKIGKSNLSLIYNIFFVSILLMMFAKFIIHIEETPTSLNVYGILIAIFILSLELRANLINTIIIYIAPLFSFIVIMFVFFNSHFNSNIKISLINIVIFIIVGFIINTVQNNFRFKAFTANYLLSVQKKELEDSNEELKVYQNHLNDLVKEKTISLHEALEKAKESDKLKTSFLLNISHEIRTPINAVEGFIEILSKKNKGIEKEFKIIDDNFNILIKTIEDILFLSKLHSENFKISRTKFHTKDFINETFSLLQKEIKKSGKEIIPILKFNKYDNYIIKSNEEYLQKALHYIIDNAIKFSNSGEIKLQCLKKDDKIIFKVSDNGQGISEEDLPHIFDNFRKFENNEILFRGVGIGMSIAKELMKKLNGEIRIESAINIGTSVEIVINPK